MCGKLGNLTSLHRIERHPFMLNADALIELAHTTLSSGELYDALIARLRDEFDADVAMLHVAAAYPMTGGGPVATLGFTEQRLKSLSHRWPVYVAELEPLRREAARTRNVVSDIDVHSPATLAKKAYHRELTVPEGGVESVVAYLNWRGCTSAAVMLGSRKQRFSAAAKAALNSLTAALSLVVAAAPSALDASPAGAVLTPREQAVLAYVEAGLSNADIARCLGSSVNTVRNQVASILRKLELSSRVEAAALRLSHYGARR